MSSPAAAVGAPSSARRSSLSSRSGSASQLDSHTHTHTHSQSNTLLAPHTASAAHPNSPSPLVASPSAPRRASTSIRSGSSEGGKHQSKYRRHSVSGASIDKGALLARVLTARELPAELKSETERNPCYWADYRVAEADIAAVWAHYNQRGDGILHKKDELARLAEDLLNRLQQVLSERFRAERPNADDQTIDRMVAKEQSAILRLGKDAKTIRSRMPEYISRSLDLDHDGSVSKAEFITQWTDLSKAILQTKEQKAIKCTIL